jgi:hypothetical protein
MEDKIIAAQERANQNVHKFSDEVRAYREKYGSQPCDYLTGRIEMLRYHQGEYNALTKLRSK